MAPKTHGGATTTDVLLPTAEIRCVEFGLFSADEIQRMSSQHVDDPIVYTKSVPRQNGLNSTSLGTVDSRISCTTCGHKVAMCPGHTGHRNLPVAVYHVGYLDTVLQLLRCVCFFCSRVLVTDLERDAFDTRSLVDKRFRFAEAVDTLKTRSVCPHCARAQPQFTKEPLRIACNFGALADKFADPIDRALAKKKFEAADALEIFRNLRVRDATVLGFDIERSAPQSMVLTTLLIPPPIMRPSIKASSGSSSRGQDDLTHKLQEILTACNVYTAADDARRAAPANASAVVLTALNAAVDEQHRRLQLMAATYYNNNVRGETKSVQRSGKEMKDLEGRLKGKNGRFRGNLTGKRVNRSGRTVVAPGPHLDIDEVGIPLELAIAIETTEIVTPYNIQNLTERVHRGPGRLDGASRVVQTADASGARRERVIDLAHCQNRQSLRLLYGWRVERPLQNGQYVMFNRQPSLHKMSMMAHRVVVLPRGIKTHNAPLAVTTMYGADFDGDEMNVLNPNELMARAELGELMSVPMQLLSAQNNRPCFGLVQDSLVGVFLLTMRTTFLTRAQMMQIVCTMRYLKAGRDDDDDDDGDGDGENNNGGDCRRRRRQVLPMPAILKPRELWTGKQLFSMLVPGHDICMERYTQNADGAVDVISGSAIGGSGGKPRARPCMNVDEHYIVMRDSELLCGSVTKDLVGRSNGGLTHIVALDLGSDVASRFLSDLQRVTIEFLEYRGFSIGISDCLPSPDAKRKVREMTSRVLGKIDFIQQQCRAIGGIGDKFLEPRITSVLGNVLDHSARIVNAGLRPSTNSVLATIQSGSKGNKINLSQILAGVGQQSVDGRRVHPTLGGNGRTLPCYRHKDTRPETRGFVTSAYSDGLRPEEFFFHAMAGREGLIDTAVKTATTGYIQRRLEKAMESIQIHYDGSVRSCDNVVDLVYGGDNMDAARLETVSMPWLAWPDAKIRAHFGAAAVMVNDNNNNNNNNNNNVGGVVVEYRDAHVAEMLKIRDEIRALRIDCMTPEFDTKFYLPVNAVRIVEKAFARFRSKKAAAAAAAADNVGADDDDDDDDDAPPIDAGYVDTVLDTVCNDTAAGLADAMGVAHPMLYKSVSLAMRASLYEAWAINRVCATSGVGGANAFDADSWLTTDEFTDAMVETVEHIIKARVCAGEMVGSLAAESVGEPFTQLTLSSVAWHTKMLFMATHIGPIRIDIGRFIDDLMDDPANSQKIVHLQENATELLALDASSSATHQYYVPSLDSDGVVGWHAVTAITRHLPGGDLLKFRTRSGREVTATRTKSVLVFRNGKFVPVDGSSVKIGDQMPTTMNLPDCVDIGDPYANDPYANDRYTAGFFDACCLNQNSHGGSNKFWAGITKKLLLAAYVAPAQYMHGFDKALGHTTTTVVSSVVSAADAADIIEILALLMCRRSVFGTIEHTPTSSTFTRATAAATAAAVVVVQNDVVLDDIVEIIRIAESQCPRVYDLTVPTTLNFVLGNGLGVRDSFHFTGVATKNVAGGVVRGKECISCSRNIKTPSLTLRLVPSISESATLSEDFARSLERVYLHNVVIGAGDLLFSEPATSSAASSGSDHATAAVSVREFIETHAAAASVLENSPDAAAACVLSAWSLVLRLDTRVLHKYKLTPADIADAVAEFGNERLFAVAAAASNGAQPVVVVRVVNLLKSIRCDPSKVLANVPMLRVVERAVVQRLQSVLLQAVHVCGVQRIKSASVRDLRVSVVDTTTGGVVERRERVVDTDGTAMQTVLAMPRVDALRSFSNDIHEINDMLGIEAASTVLFHELMRVLSFDGTYVNDRHVVTVVRTIARHGYLMPITRHGINRLDTGTLMRASFEETVDVLYDAAAFGETDRVAGVTEAIMVGKRARMGTGLCDILDDFNGYGSGDGNGGDSGSGSDAAADNADVFDDDDDVVFTRSCWTPKRDDETFENYGFVDFNNVVPMDRDTRVPISKMAQNRAATTAKGAPAATKGAALSAKYRPSSPTPDDIADLFAEPTTTTTSSAALVLSSAALDDLFSALGFSAPATLR